MFICQSAQSTINVKQVCNSGGWINCMLGKTHQSPDYVLTAQCWFVPVWFLFPVQFNSAGKTVCAAYDDLNI